MYVTSVEPTATQQAVCVCVCVCKYTESPLNIAKGCDPKSCAFEST